MGELYRGSTTPIIAIHVCELRINNKSVNRVVLFCFQYLQLRFNSSIRIMASVLCTISLLLYIPIVVYVPALALSQGTLLYFRMQKKYPWRVECVVFWVVTSCSVACSYNGRKITASFVDRYKWEGGEDRKTIARRERELNPFLILFDVKQLRLGGRSSATQDSCE
jgi:hypothetical protein